MQNYVSFAMILRHMNICYFLCLLVKYIWNITSVSLGINSIPAGFGESYMDWFNNNFGRSRRAIMIGSIAII
jgi:hypothetical protein